ncbi:hypothetical protein [Pseudomonas sp. ANT_J28]|uniref:hypothetical protein n=1 Tax=Pseudomonas sp. ANT_J28 TaxID=2597352 RepID=UPI0011F240D1|nr:hypothetical protein [Pseudomonas sp. ANT_J28]KAA0987075.1 hypothetical protein FQ187_00290 [Pseudomonas sp. ANT_J28]
MIINKIKKTIFLIRIYLLIISCAGFHTVVILSIISYFIEVDYMIARLMGVICFAGLSVYFLVAFPKKLQEALQGKRE